MLGIPYQFTEIIFRFAVSGAESGASRLYFYIYIYCCLRLPASLILQCTLFALTLKVYQNVKIIQVHFLCFYAEVDNEQREAAKLLENL